MFVYYWSVGCWNDSETRTWKMEEGGSWDTSLRNSKVSPGTPPAFIFPPTSRRQVQQRLYKRPPFIRDVLLTRDSPLWWISLYKGLPLRYKDRGIRKAESLQRALVPRPTARLRGAVRAGSWVKIGLNWVEGRCGLPAKKDRALKSSFEIRLRSRCEDLPAKDGLSEIELNWVELRRVEVIWERIEPFVISFPASWEEVGISKPSKKIGPAPRNFEVFWGAHLGWDQPR